jgi:hypothetical protein
MKLAASVTGHGTRRAEGSSTVAAADWCFVWECWLEILFRNFALPRSLARVLLSLSTSFGL